MKPLISVNSSIKTLVRLYEVIDDDDDLDYYTLATISNFSSNANGYQLLSSTELVDGRKGELLVSGPDSRVYSQSSPFSISLFSVLSLEINKRTKVTRRINNNKVSWDFQDASATGNRYDDGDDFPTYAEYSVSENAKPGFDITVYGCDARANFTDEKTYYIKAK